MKKLLVAISAIILSASSAYAGAKVGVSVTGFEFDSAKGTEESNGDVTSRTESLAMALGSIFVETSVLDLFSVGLDYVPYALQSETVSNQRRDAEGVDNHTQNVSVDIENLTTVYLLLPLGDAGAFIKAGVSHADVVVNESMKDSQTYSDEEMIGGHLSLGLEKDMGPVFIRGTVGISEYETVISESSTGNTRVKDALGDGIHAGITIGKAF